MPLLMTNAQTLGKMPVSLCYCGTDVDIILRLSFPAGGVVS